MCKDRFLGPSDYRIFDDWSSIDRSKEGYLHTRDGLVLEGGIQEMENKENYYEKGPYKAHVHAFFLVTIKCAPIIVGSHSVQQTWSIIANSK
jgi:hypothetical protein